MAAIELYKLRQPRLKQDHPQFVQWCIGMSFCVYEYLYVYIGHRYGV